MHLLLQPNVWLYNIKKLQQYIKNSDIIVSQLVGWFAACKAPISEETAEVY